jgi:hypothetical protein
MKEIFNVYPQFLLDEKQDLKEQVLLKLQQLGELKKIAS